MQRLDFGQSLKTEFMEFGVDGLRQVELSGPEISVRSSISMLLENWQDVIWIRDAALVALASPSSVDGQEAIFEEILSSFPDSSPEPLSPEQVDEMILYILERDGELTPLESLVAGTSAIAGAMEVVGLSASGLGVVFAWRSQADDVECRVESEDDVPMLVLEHGSLSATLLTLKGMYIASKWMLGVYGWVRPNFTGAPQAAAWFVEQLRARAMASGHGSIPLDRIDQPNNILTYDPEKHSKVIVYVHGLFSTDAGTFDGFRDALSNIRINLYMKAGLDRKCVEGAFDSVGHVGFPHDTLCGIDRSGQILADHLIARFEDINADVALIAHSRGGLVVRRAIQHLLSRGRGWENRIKYSATFGTPHAGANLARIPGRYEGSYLLLKGQADRLIALDMLFCYLKHAKRIDGIDDLSPVGNPISTFIKDLKEREAGQGVVSTYATSGRAPSNYGAGVKALITKSVRMGIDKLVGVQNDLVVSVGSAESAPSPVIRSIDCDHFGYFSHKDAMRNTAIEILRSFGVGEAINACAVSNVGIVEFCEVNDRVVLKVGGSEL